MWRGYWGKLGDGHQDLVMNHVRALPEGAASVILHLGVGPPGHADIPDLAWKVYDSTRRIEYDERGDWQKVFTKTIDYIYSDVVGSQKAWGKSPDAARFRSRQVDAVGAVSGVQEFRLIDARKIDLSDTSVDLQFAFGLFSHRAALGVGETSSQTALREMCRVCRPSGRILISVGGAAIDSLVADAETAGLQVEARHDAPDPYRESGDPPESRRWLFVMRRHALSDDAGRACSG